MRELSKPSKGSPKRVPFAGQSAGQIWLECISIFLIGVAIFWLGGAL